jgi:hypothetical protein
MTTTQIVKLIDQIGTLRVSTNFFNDHRWIHLNVMIVKNLDKFSISDKLKICIIFVMIVKGLTRLNQFS